MGGGITVSQPSLSSPFPSMDWKVQDTQIRKGKYFELEKREFKSIPFNPITFTTGAQVTGTTSLRSTTKFFHGSVQQCHLRLSKILEKLALASPRPLQE